MGVRSAQAVSEALTAAVSPARLNAGASSGSISAFNWARWEQRLRDTRRKEQWQAEIKKIEGTRTHIWGSEDCVPKPRLASFEYKNWRHQYAYACLAIAQAQLKQSFRHIRDVHAMVYGMMKHGNHMQRYSRTPQIKQPEYYERTGEITCPMELHKAKRPLTQALSNSTAGVRSQNALSWRGQGRTATLKPAGRPSRTRRRYTT